MRTQGDSTVGGITPRPETEISSACDQSYRRVFSGEAGRGHREIASGGRSNPIPRNIFRCAIRDLGESARFFGATPMKRRARFWGRHRQAGPDVRLGAHRGRSGDEGICPEAAADGGSQSSLFPEISSASAFHLSWKRSRPNTAGMNRVVPQTSGAHRDGPPGKDRAARQIRHDLERGAARPAHPSL